MDYIDYLGSIPRSCYRTKSSIIHQLTYPKDPIREFRGLNGSSVFTVSKLSHDTAKVIHLGVGHTLGVGHIGGRTLRILSLDLFGEQT